MDVGTNKTRKDTRAVVSLVARYRSPSTFEYVEEACCDVSLGGMFIRSKDPAAAGTLLKLECESGVGEHIRGVARVVWLRGQQNEYGPSGMGVKFVKLDPESRDLITRIVQELAEAGIEAPTMSSAPEQRGKPPSKRPGTASSTPAAAAPPPPPRAAEISSMRPLSSNPARNDGAMLQRAAATPPPPPPPSSSKPPAHSGTSSRPAPSNALLARANVEPLEVETGDARPSSTGLAPLQELGRDLEPPQEVGRDLAPLQAMVRSSRVSSAPPLRSDERSGRAFWLVAGAVVALGAIVALFSMRAAHEAAPGEPQANKGAPPALEAPAPGTVDHADPAQSEPTKTPTTEGASSALAAAQAAEAPAFADPEQVAPAESDGTPSDVTQVPVATPETPAEIKAATPTTSTAIEGTASPASARSSTPPLSPSTPQPSAAANTGPQPSAAATAPPPAARPAAPEVPVLRITPADSAPSDKPAAAQPQASAQPSAASAIPAPAPAQQPSAPAPNDTAAASSTTPAANAQPPANKVAPPPLPPGEIARVITFTSRPSGASVFVGDQSVTTPGELNLGAMPSRIRVTAQKEGFESSTVWINNTAEFVKVGGVMRREVHFVFRALPAAAVVPGQPAPAKQAPPGASSPAAPSSTPSQP